MIEKHWAHTCTARPLNEQTIALSTAHYPQCGKPRPTPSASMESAVEADGKLWSFLHDSLHEAHKKLNATGGGEVYYAALDSIAAKLEKDVNGRFIASLTAELAEAREQLFAARQAALSEGLARDSLRDECERLREDAMRYRWLRDANAADPESEDTFVGIDNDKGGCWIGCDLDRYVDGKMTALSASGRKGE